MTNLVLGANTVINHPQCHVAFSAQGNLQFGQQLGMLCLPLDEQRKAAASPAYLHETKEWVKLEDETNSKTPTSWTIDLKDLFDNKKAHYLQFIVYAYHIEDINLPTVEVDDIHLNISFAANNHAISYHFKSHERHVKAAIVLEFYQRNGVFKCRALGETSTQGLDSLAQRVGISLDTRPPATHDALQAAQSQQQNVMPNDNHRPPRQVTAGETWTGTAFAIDPHHLLTCYHVIESASMLGIRQQGEADREVQVVMSDIGSDMALIKVRDPLPSYLPLASHCGDLLGETITTLGFPLSGLNSQLQVTQGCISGLTGFKDDIRYMQFTAPIQPGSSGSPLLLPTGEVVGMVTASLTQAQNMNYAVKFQLLSALLTSAGVGLRHLNSSSSNSQPLGSQSTGKPLTTPELSRQSRGALWLVGAQA